MEFKAVFPADYQRLKNYFDRQPYHLSAYSLCANLVWRNPSYYPVAAVDNGALVLAAEYNFRPDLRHLMLPISPQRQYAPPELAALALRARFQNVWFVPEDYLSEYGQDPIAEHFTITPQTEFEDYVYSRDDLATLKGNKYSKKRNLINQFKKEYLKNGRVRVETISTGDVEECLMFLEQWCVERDCDAVPDNEDLACEKHAAINTLLNLQDLAMEGLLVRIDGRVSAFGIASHLTRDMGVLHFEKAFGDIKGLYQFLDQACAQKLFEGYRYINKESDMDLPGLAKAKKSYHPVMKVPSFCLTLR